MIFPFEQGDTGDEVSLDFSREQLIERRRMAVEREVITRVLERIPNEQYATGYVDPKGKEGFRNPVRQVVGRGLENIVDKLHITYAVELGTALGRSGLHMALGGLRRLDTVEFDAEAADTARANFDTAGLPAFRVYNRDSGEFTRTFTNPEAIQLLFVDHAKERYLEDLRTLEPHLAPNALVLMDNTFNRASECKDAVAYVAENYWSSIFTEPPTNGEVTGLLVASKDKWTFEAAMKSLLSVRT